MIIILYWEHNYNLFFCHFVKVNNICIICDKPIYVNINHAEIINVNVIATGPINVIM